MTPPPTAAVQAGAEQVRLMAVASRLYHVHGLRQRDIGERLGMSQARVSRLLHQAEQQGLVRTVVAAPDGVDPELEERLEARFGLREAHVVAVPAGTVDLAVPLGRAAARWMGEAGVTGEVLGFTSWSRTLQVMAGSLPPLHRTGTRVVVEMLGDLGSPLLQHAAARSTQDVANAVGAEPVFLRTPGVAATPGLRAAALGDPHVQRALGLLERLGTAFVGVGPVAGHSTLRVGESWFTEDQLAAARAAGAVGQLNQRALDAAGGPLPLDLDDLLVGSTLEHVRAAARRVVVAGGPDKEQALSAALSGGWVDVLVTDTTTAASLLAAPAPAGPDRADRADRPARPS